MCKKYDCKGTISYNLESIRNSKKISQRRLSYLSGVSQSSISNIENGEKHPTVPILCKLAKALGVTIDQLVNY